MAELIQLDKAGSLVGKSEVTIRRLIKAGKIPFKKEKTLTGFIYLVNPDHVRAYYKGRGEAIEEAIQEMESEEVPVQKPGGVRVAVAGESGNAHEYWQKKAELYEERYNHEVVKHAQAREELGVWRGRAEQAQSMLLKLLPAPADLDVKSSTPTVIEKTPTKSSELWLSVVFAVVAVVLLVVLAGVAYLYLRQGLV